MKFWHLPASQIVHRRGEAGLARRVMNLVGRVENVAALQAAVEDHGTRDVGSIERGETGIRRIAGEHRTVVIEVRQRTDEREGVDVLNTCGLAQRVDPMIGVALDTGAAEQ